MHDSVCCDSYEVIETPTDILLIMEYVGGGELFEHIVSNGKVRESFVHIWRASPRTNRCLNQKLVDSSNKSLQL